MDVLTKFIFHLNQFEFIDKKKPDTRSFAIRYVHSMFFSLNSSVIFSTAKKVLEKSVLASSLQAKIAAANLG